MEDLPQTKIMLENAFTTQCIKVERASQRLRVGAHRLRKEDNGIALRDVETFEHGIGEYVARDLPPVRRQVAMVGESVKTRAWASC